MGASRDEADTEEDLVSSGQSCDRFSSAPAYEYGCQKRHNFDESKCRHKNATYFLKLDRVSAMGVFGSGTSTVQSFSTPPPSPILSYTLPCSSASTVVRQSETEVLSIRLPSRNTARPS